MTTVTTTRAQRYADAPVPSLGTTLDKAVKLISKMLSDLEAEVMGNGEKSAAADPHLVKRAIELAKTLDSVVGAQTRYDKAGKDRAKTLTDAQFRDVIRKFLFSRLDMQTRAKFIKELAKEHVELGKKLGYYHANSRTLEDSKEFEGIEQTAVHVPVTEPGGGGDE